MGHFGLDKWVDFARDVIDETQKTAMERHLESGCADCGTVLHTWKRIQEIGCRDSLYEPPDSAIRFVKGAYAIEGRHKSGPHIPVMARLLFDSFSQALPVGVRSLNASARQLRYESGAYEVDLRLEPQFDSDKVSVVGQVLRPDQLDRPVNEIPVALIRDDEIVAASVTSPLGEFRLDCDLEGSFKLRFEPSKGNDFYIPLIHPGVTRPSSGPNGSTTTLRSSAKRRAK
jgi:hypothetical protein